MTISNTTWQGANVIEINDSADSNAELNTFLRGSNSGYNSDVDTSNELVLSHSLYIPQDTFVQLEGYELTVEQPFLFENLSNVSNGKVMVDRSKVGADITSGTGLTALRLIDCVIRKKLTSTLDTSTGRCKIQGSYRSAGGGSLRSVAKGHISPLQLVRSIMYSSAEEANNVNRGHEGISLAIDSSIIFSPLISTNESANTSFFLCSATYIDNFTIVNSARVTAGPYATSEAPVLIRDLTIKGANTQFDLQSSNIYVGLRFVDNTVTSNLFLRFTGNNIRNAINMWHNMSIFLDDILDQLEHKTTDTNVRGCPLYFISPFKIRCVDASASPVEDMKVTVSLKRGSGSLFNETALNFSEVAMSYVYNHTQYGSDNVDAGVGYRSRLFNNTGAWTGDVTASTISVNNDSLDGDDEITTDENGEADVEVRTDEIIYGSVEYLKTAFSDHIIKIFQYGFISQIFEPEVRYDTETERTVRVLTRETIRDELISEEDKSVVEAYTSVDNANKFYDLIRSLEVDNKDDLNLLYQDDNDAWKGHLLSVTGNTIVFPANSNLMLDTDNGSVAEVDYTATAREYTIKDLPVITSKFNKIDLSDNGNFLNESPNADNDFYADADFQIEDRNNDLIPVELEPIPLEEELNSNTPSIIQGNAIDVSYDDVTYEGSDTTNNKFVFRKNKDHDGELSIKEFGYEYILSLVEELESVKLSIQEKKFRTYNETDARTFVGTGKIEWDETNSRIKVPSNYLTRDVLINALEVLEKDNKEDLLSDDGDSLYQVLDDDGKELRIFYDIEIINAVSGFNKQTGDVDLELLDLTDDYNLSGNEIDIATKDSTGLKHKITLGTNGVYYGNYTDEDDTVTEIAFTSFSGSTTSGFITTPANVSLKLYVHREGKQARFFEQDIGDDALNLEPEFTDLANYDSSVDISGHIDNLTLSQDSDGDDFLISVMITDTNTLPEFTGGVWVSMVNYFYSKQDYAEVCIEIDSATMIEPTATGSGIKINKPSIFFNVPDTAEDVVEIAGVVDTRTAEEEENDYDPTPKNTTNNLRVVFLKRNDDEYSEQTGRAVARESLKSVEDKLNNIENVVEHLPVTDEVANRFVEDTLVNNIALTDISSVSDTDSNDDDARVDNYSILEHSLHILFKNYPNSDSEEVEIKFAELSTEIMANREKAFYIQLLLVKRFDSNVVSIDPQLNLTLFNNGSEVGTINKGTINLTYGIPTKIFFDLENIRDEDDNLVEDPTIDQVAMNISKVNSSLLNKTELAIEEFAFIERFYNNPSRDDIIDELDNIDASASISDDDKYDIVDKFMDSPAVNGHTKKGTVGEATAITLSLANDTETLTDVIDNESWSHSFTGGGLVLAQSTRQQEDDGRLNDKYYWQYAITNSNDEQVITATHTGLTYMVQNRSIIEAILRPDAELTGVKVEVQLRFNGTYTDIIDVIERNRSNDDRDLIADEENKFFFSATNEMRRNTVNGIQIKITIPNQTITGTVNLDLFALLERFEVVSPELEDISNAIEEVPSKILDLDVLASARAGTFGDILRGLYLLVENSTDKAEGTPFVSSSSHYTTTTAGGGGAGRSIDVANNRLKFTITGNITQLIESLNDLSLELKHTTYFFIEIHTNKRINPFEFELSAIEHETPTENLDYDEFTTVEHLTDVRNIELNDDETVSFVAKGVDAHRDKTLTHLGFRLTREEGNTHLQRSSGTVITVTITYFTFSEELINTLSNNIKDIVTDIESTVGVIEGNSSPTLL